MRRLLSRLRAGALAALPGVDGRDLIAALGTILVAVGLWMIAPPLAFIIVGVLMLWAWAWTSPVFRKGG